MGIISHAEEAEAMDAVSFLIPAYNQEKFIAEAVAGALSQTFQPLHIIISDDASTDGTFAAIQQAVAGYDGPHRVTVRRNERNLRTDHFNLLFSLADSEFFVIAHGDDISFPERTSSLVQQLSDPKVMMVNSNCVLMSETGTIAGLLEPLAEKPPTTLEMLSRGGWSPRIIPSTAAFRRRVIDQFGPLDPGFIPQLGMDQILSMRAALLGEIRYLPQPLTFKRQHPGSATNRVVLNKTGNWLEMNESIAAHNIAQSFHCLWQIEQQMLSEPNSPRLMAAHRRLREHVLHTGRDWVQTRNSLMAAGFRNWWLAKPPAGRDTSRAHYYWQPAVPRSAMPAALQARISDLRGGEQAPPPEDVSATARRASALCDRHDYLEAELLLRAAVVTHSRHAGLWVLLARAQSGRRDWQAAYDHARCSIALHPAFSVSWVMLARAARGLRSFEEARQAMRRAFVLDCGNPAIAQDFADLLAEVAGDRQSALWRHTWPTVKDRPDAVLQLLDQLAEDTAAAPDAADANDMLNRLSSEAELRQFTQRLTQRLRETPEDAGLRQTLASCQLALGDNQSAIATLGGGRTPAASERDHSANLRWLATHRATRVLRVARFDDTAGLLPLDTVEWQPASGLLLCGDAIHYDLVHHLDRKPGLGPQPVAVGAYRIAALPRAGTVIEQRCILLGGCRNYYHWLIDHLPRLRLCEDLALPIAINRDPAPFQLQSLEGLGLADRVLPLPPDDMLRLTAAVLPQRRGTGPDSDDIAWLRRRMLPQAAGRGDRVFISRSAASHRQAVNEAEIQAIACQAGYRVVALEHLGFAEQVALFAGAAAVAGVHGAGFANLVFAPPGCRVIEFVGRYRTPGFYRRIAELGGLDYRPVACAIASGSGGTEVEHHDIVIDPGMARQALA